MVGQCRTDVVRQTRYQMSNRTFASCERRPSVIKAGIFHSDHKAGLFDLPETKLSPEFGHLVCHGQWLRQPIPVHGRVKDGGNVCNQSTDVRRTEVVPDWLR